MRHRWPRWWDIAIAVVAASALIVDGVRRGEASIGVGDYLLAALTAAPLIWRVRAPLTVLLLVMAGVIACVAAFEPANVAVFVVMIPLYTVAELGGRRRSLAVGVGTAVVLVLVLVAFESGGAIGPEDWLRLVLAAGALVVGDTVRSRRALAAASPGSGCGSHESCTTRWPTRSWRSTSGPAWRCTSPKPAAVRRRWPRSRTSPPKRWAICVRR